MNTKRVKDSPDTEIEKLDLRSHDIATEKTEQLLTLFPEIRTEGGKIDFDQLKRVLGGTVDPGKERYGMNWSGKADCFKTIQQPTLATLRPCPEESVNFDTTENLIIEGDNLEVLKLLQKSYIGKIKMIYIDPPYNTGSDFIYPDNYSESLQTYLEYTNQVDGEGKKFSTNTDTDGRFHSKWLNMMYPRLYLAKNLLREDGVIFISIDENEINNLIVLLNDIFGEDSKEGIICWRRRHNQPNDKTKMIGKVAEFICAYAKNPVALRAAGVGKIDITGKFSNPDNDPRGDWASKPWKVGSGQSGCRYKITTPTGIVLDEEWMGDKETYCALFKDNRIVFPKKGSGSPRKKYFKSEREEEGQCATNWWSHEEFGHNQGANDQMTALFGVKNIFDNPKPFELIRGLIQISNAKKDDIILDFFAGSGSTAQAVLEINKEDAANRKFILIQLPEPVDNNNFSTIADITKERIRRAIKSVVKGAEEADEPISQNLDLGFKAFKLVESNFKPWQANLPSGDTPALAKQLELHISHLRPGRTSSDILYEILLKSGFQGASRLNLSRQPTRLSLLMNLKALIAPTNHRKLSKLSILFALCVILQPIKTHITWFIA